MLESEDNRKEHYMQNFRKKILEILGVYIASWTLTYIILPTLSAIYFGPIAGSILGTAFYSCFLFLVLETAIITVKVLERKIRRKAKHAASNVQETPHISLRIVGTYAISLSLTVNIFLVVDPLSIYYPQADETLIRAFIVSIAIMILLLTAQIIHKIRHNKNVNS